MIPEGLKKNENNNKEDLDMIEVIGKNEFIILLVTKEVDRNIEDIEGVCATLKILKHILKVWIENKKDSEHNK